MKPYAIANMPTPILNRSDFSRVFGGHDQQILLDEIGLLRPLEMIALEGEVFKCKSEVSDTILEVKYPGYPSDSPLYIDRRFIEFTEGVPEVTKKEPVIDKEILKSFESMLDLPYIWGGNVSSGIEEMKKLYPIPEEGKLSKLEQANWTFSGVDCSGMLYEATNGACPRNSSWMQEMGEPLNIEGKSASEVLKMLKPLDAIIWHTHVLFVLDDTYTIESRACRGCVFKTKIQDRLQQIEEIENKTPMNTSKRNDFLEKGYLIRRWYPTYHLHGAFFQKH
ncbi:MAG: hypothetical protein S4CHLAM37_00110 [Chlamydiia bacterium]|nr:hypothetical protein [Chlamydiia bacterium]